MSKKENKKKLVLLDSHAILHRAYHALPDFSSPTGEPTGALYGVVAMLLKIVEELKPDYIIACYDLPQPTYRHEAYADYKAGRTKTDNELVKQIIRSRDIFTAFSIPIYENAGFEADDILGTIAEQTKSNNDLEVVIASGDMDTLQLVEKKRVQVYTLKKGINDTILYDEKAVNDRFGFPPKLIPDYKGLRGDPSDNIPGIAGIGEKGGGDLIREFGSLEQIYKKLHKDEEAFTKKGIKSRLLGLLKEGEEEALFSKMLATIRRDAPIDFTLPDKSWRESLDLDTALSLFSELGFRTLSTRLRHLFDTPEDKDEAPIIDMPEALINEAAIKIWLLESDRTSCTAEEIIDYGRNYFQTTDISEIIKKLDEGLKEQNLTSLYEAIEKPLQPIIKKMKEVGIKLDTSYLKKLSQQFQKELQKLEKTIHKEADDDFNINSTKQLGEILYQKLGLKPKNQKKTAGGKLSTRESELEKLKDEHPIIPAILRYRELQKLQSTYVKPLPEMIGSDGRLHSSFLQTGTTTGRISSNNPNLQNIPVKSAEGRMVRKGFISEQGYTLVAIDYSQIELRIAAIMSGDKELIEIFKRGEDVHTGVAMRVFNVKEGEVTPNMRRQAKVINFGILYGMGVNALRQNLGVDTKREEAQEFLNAYFQTFTKLAEYLEETKQFARDNGYTLTLFNRRRHFPTINAAAPFIRAAAERMAINAPIQGTAADIVRVAMLKTDDYIKTTKDATVRLLLQVHDELIFEVKTNELKKVIPNLVKLMREVLNGKHTTGVPIEVEVKTGENWQDLIKW